MDLRDQLQSALGHAYTIERELGGGGMSRVFVAMENALARQVVVKVLPSELAGQDSADRFKREISLAAQLQHPHIVPLLTAGDAGGLPYFTMPFIKGESLRARLAAHGELPVNEAVRILREVASALAFAHAAGVVHRDIKPDNVLLSGGAAMVTDFGVAKALHSISASRGSDITSVGVALGTPAYMAPEQASADPLVDYRADIYACGVLAYELLTGSTPFSGRTTLAMLAAHVNELAEHISRRRPAIPRALADLVMRCLEKRAADRPQSAEELVRILDELATASGGLWPTSARPPSASSPPHVRRRWIGMMGATTFLIMSLVTYSRLHRASQGAAAGRSIAVLPFENKSHDSTYDYLAEGMSDELRSALNAVPGLSVKARSSSIRLRGFDAREVGEKLSVDKVLQGTVSRAGSRLHVTAELVSAGDENTLWSVSFDRPTSDLSAVQDSIKRAILSALQVRLASNQAGARISGSPNGTSDFEAHDLYLNGKFHLNRLEYGRAAEFFKGAVARDAQFARAHANLAWAYALLPTTGFGSRDSLLALARESVDRAFALDSTLVDAWVANGNILVTEMRLADAERTFAKAVILDPGNAAVLQSHSFALGSLGRLDEALALGRRAHQVDPLDVGSLLVIQYTLYAQRQYRAAIDATRSILDLDPRSVSAYQNMGLAYAFLRMPDSAVAAFETGIRIDPKMFGGRMYMMFGYAAAGRWADAERVRAILNREGGNSPHFIKGIADLTFGKPDAAFSEIERGIEQREPLFQDLSLPCDPLFDPLKSNPRFDALARRLGAKTCPASGPWPIRLGSP